MTITLCDHHTPELLSVSSSVPMLMLYSLIQKHFVMGLMVGSIKGPEKYEEAHAINESSKVFWQRAL